MASKKLFVSSPTLAERGLTSVQRNVNIFSIAATFRDKWYKTGGFFDPAFAGEYDVIVDRVQSWLLAIGHQDLSGLRLAASRRRALVFLIPPRVLSEP